MSPNPHRAPKGAENSVGGQFTASQRSRQGGLLPTQADQFESSASAADVEELVSSTDVAVRQEATRNPMTSGTQHLRLAYDQDTTVRMHEAMSGARGASDRASRDPGPFVRVLASMNSDLSADAAARLEADREVMFLRAVLIGAAGAHR